MVLLRDSSVDIAAGTDWTAGIRFSAGARDFAFLHNVQTGSEMHSASYPMGTGFSFPRGKADRA
jgi:hypothetical protein